MPISWADPTQTTHFVKFPCHSRFAPQGEAGSGEQEKRTASSSSALPKRSVRAFSCRSSRRHRAGGYPATSVSPLTEEHVAWVHSPCGVSSGDPEGQ